MDEPDIPFDLDGPSTSAQAATAAEEAGRPDEVLAVSGGFDGRKVWLVKVPKFLQERWAQVEEQGKHLATMRVYEQQPGETAPRISLILPSADEAEYDTADLVTEYDLTIVPEPTAEEGGRRSTGYLMTDTRRDARQRLNPKLHSAIHHTASLRPRLSATYSKSLRDRQARADKPKRTMMRLDEESLGAGKVAQMASGFVGNAASSSSGGAKGKGRFGGFEAKPKNLDKAHRLPRNELLDLLFPLFQEHTYWRLKTLKQRTQQPEAYLKEVLGEIGVLVKRGPYVGCWTLMEIYKTPAQQQQQQQQQQAAGSSGGVKTESGAVKSELGGADDGEDDDDDDDASDEDMEEV